MVATSATRATGRTPILRIEKPADLLSLHFPAYNSPQRSLRTAVETLQPSQLNHDSEGNFTKFLSYPGNACLRAGNISATVISQPAHCPFAQLLPRIPERLAKLILQSAIERLSHPRRY